MAKLRNPEVVVVGINSIGPNEVSGTALGTSPEAVEEAVVEIGASVGAVRIEIEHLPTGQKTTVFDPEKWGKCKWTPSGTGRKVGRD